MFDNVKPLNPGCQIGTIELKEETVILNFLNKVYHIDSTVFAGLLNDYSEITVDKGLYR